MEETMILILLVIVMFVGSYVIGSIPLVMPMSEVLAVLHFYSKGSYQLCIGQNYLLGMSQCTVSKSLHEVSTAINYVLPREFIKFPQTNEAILEIKQRRLITSNWNMKEKLQLVSVLGAGLLVGTALAVIIPEGVRSLDSVSFSHIQTTAKYATNVAAHAEPAKISEAHSLIGISLVLGFVFMLLVDQCSASRSRDLESAVKSAERDITATVGLVVHAAADGVALGAAATTAQAGVEMIVFIAIMLHKETVCSHCQHVFNYMLTMGANCLLKRVQAPAAFGLVTFLLHEGLERNRIRRHLIVFALSAPVMAMLTYFGIGQEGKETLSSVNATGIAMLFSAGTFLYVATVHVLPELTSRAGHTHGGALIEPAVEKKGLHTKELIFLIVGALLPLLLTVGHHH